MYTMTYNEYESAIKDLVNQIIETAKDNPNMDREEVIYEIVSGSAMNIYYSNHFGILTYSNHPNAFLDNGFSIADLSGIEDIRDINAQFVYWALVADITDLIDQETP